MSKRLLIIDSDESLASELASAAAAKGFQTLRSSSSTEGFEIAQAERPDLIVLNVELEPTKGWAVCTKLKKDPELSLIPVVLTSIEATDDTFEKHRKLKTRADEYLHKPYDAASLVQLAGTLLGLPDADEPLVELDDSLGFDEDIVIGDDESFEDLGDELLEAEGAGLEEVGLEEWGEEEIVAFEDEESGLEEASIEAFAEGSFATEEFSTGALAVDASSAEGEALGDDVDPLGAVDWGNGDDPLAEADVSFGSFDDGDFASFDTPAPSAEAPAAVSAEDEFETGEFDAELSTFDEGVYEEAPLDIASGESGLAAAAEEHDEFGDALEDLSFDANSIESGLEGDALGESDFGRLAELDTRLTTLEAENEGLRAAEAARDEELRRAHEDLRQKERELTELRVQFESLRESESRLGADSARASTERARAEATIKALAGKAEQLAGLVRKNERELAVTREEARKVSGLEQRLAELDESARAQAFELENLRNELQNARQEADGLRADLDEERRTAQRALENASTLQEKLADANERLASAEGRLAELGEVHAAARDTLLQLVERFA